MDRLTVHALKGTQRRVVVLQYPGLDTGSTLLVAPLYPAEDGLVLATVTPKVRLDDEDFLIAMHLLAAVPKQELGPAEASLAAEEYPITNALNRLFFGI